jgi:cardiolipin synthase
LFLVDTLADYLSQVEWGFQFWGWLGFVAAAATSVHVIMRKRDSRSAIAWMGLIWLSPFVGAFLYLILGVNRIRRRAQAMRPRLEGLPMRETIGENIGIDSAGQLRLGDKITQTSAVGGNTIRKLINGEQAYPAMLAAIEHSRFSITLGTYIFDHDDVGLRFADALVAAVQRGVEVRVLIDDVGARYSKRRMDRLLRNRGVRVANFLPLFRPKSFFFLNLRLHRKILVIDGMIAFTGGMNIRSAHEVSRGLPASVQDTHFEVRGPIVRDLQQVFVDDWEFTTRETLKGGAWFPPLSEQGSVLARCVDDGPDLHFENARWILLGAITGARKKIRIMTPYFLPDITLVTALNAAALRGVHVQIVLPQENNLPWVSWASTGNLSQIMERGCEVYFSPPPFDHSKLMTMDDQWVFFGSVNWDERSLRLNFELNVEAFDTALTAEVNQHIEGKIKVARRMTLDDLNHRSFGAQLRDGTARLFAPYL